MHGFYLPAEFWAGACAALLLCIGCVIWGRAALRRGRWVQLFIAQVLGFIALAGVVLSGLVIGVMR